MSDRLVVGCYNVGGKPRDGRVVADVRDLHADHGIDVLGLCEMGDRAAVAKALPAVLRKSKGGAARVALSLDGVTHDEWDAFRLNRGHEPVERLRPATSGLRRPRWSPFPGATPAFVQPPRE